MEGFVDNGDGTISDKATGLMWVKDPLFFLGPPFDAPMNWNDAIINCESLSFAGHDDWRLPNVFELISILDLDIQKNNMFAPSIDNYFFPNTFNSPYWSSTEWAISANIAFMVHFGYGYGNILSKNDLGFIRPVRGRPIETKNVYLILGIGIVALLFLILNKKFK